MAPFFFWVKPSGEGLRGIQDYQQLNEVMVKDQYPLPLIGEVVDHLVGSACFTKMDLHWGFNNVRIHASDEEKVAFITERGLFEPIMMQLGLCNAPTTFQRMMDDVLWEEKASSHVDVYIDDIMVHMEDQTLN
jgi:hypothetical protein